MGNKTSKNCRSNEENRETDGGKGGPKPAKSRLLSRRLKCKEKGKDNQNDEGNDDEIPISSYELNLQQTHHSRSRRVILPTINRTNSGRFVMRTVTPSTSSTTPTSPATLVDPFARRDVSVDDSPGTTNSAATRYFSYRIEDGQQQQRNFATEGDVQVIEHPDSDIPDFPLMWYERPDFYRQHGTSEVHEESIQGQERTREPSPLLTEPPPRIHLQGLDEPDSSLATPINYTPHPYPAQAISRIGPRMHQCIHCNWACMNIDQNVLLSCYTCSVLEPGMNSCTRCRLRLCTGCRDALTVRGMTLSMLMRAMRASVFDHLSSS